MPSGKKRAERTALAGARVQKFIQQYGRHARPPGMDPNDRSYDRRLEDKIKRMNPEKLDALMRDNDLE